MDKNVRLNEVLAYIHKMALAKAKTKKDAIRKKQYQILANSWFGFYK